MARGETPRPNEAPGLVAFVGAFGAIALVATLFVVLLTHACDSCESAFLGAAGGDPYVGASTAARLLGWRDEARLRATYGAPPPVDGAAAALAVTADLSARGHGDPDAAMGPLTMPSDVTVPALEGSCGVVVFEGEATSLVRSAGRAGELRVADDPSLVTIGACGAGPYRVEGIGTVLVRVHLVPGLVESDVARTGLTDEALVAHAEAEHLLATMGYLPDDELVRLEVTTPTTILPALPAPSSGCTPWAVVVVGARARSTLLGVPPAYSAQRGLALAVTCAGTASHLVETTDDPSPGFVAWARPFGAPAGPTLPSTTTTTIGRAHVVDAARLSLPASMPEATAP